MSDCSHWPWYWSKAGIMIDDIDDCYSFYIYALTVCVCERESDKMMCLLWYNVVVTQTHRSYILTYCSGFQLCSCWQRYWFLWPDLRRQRKLEKIRWRFLMCFWMLLKVLWEHIQKAKMKYSDNTEWVIFINNDLDLTRLEKVEEMHVLETCKRLKELLSVWCGMQRSSDNVEIFENITCCDDEGIVENILCESSSSEALSVIKKKACEDSSSIQNHTCKCTSLSPAVHFPRVMQNKEMYKQPHGDSYWTLSSGNNDP